MFGGIIEEIGTIAGLEPAGGEHPLTIRCRTVLEETRLGDSISVNGVCLTVTTLREDAFVANLQPVTLRLTNLGNLRPGLPVNLERALAVGARIGGHYVQGHIDGVGRLVALRNEGRAVVAHLAVPPEIQRYIVERGFIAVDGASLTVMEVHPDGFSVSLVSHTQDHTILSRQRPGYQVNLEVDIIAKYVERLMGSEPREQPGGVEWDLLRRAGYA
jgi:riboflavin synthase